ncbi:MAG: L,D-transpeptidase [Thiothrix litoralis]|jgi:lipoprotein-anchoring transpeptidase ErfK/SrfK|uniref:L,D-transpeptidase family protein n=1 Tax=Thiothrix litoralis TaxID=2891210 RepID=UPI003C73D243
MTNNKHNVKKIWLPLIFATAIHSGAVMAEDFPMPPLNSLPQAAAVEQGKASVDFIVQDLQRRFPGYSTERVLLVDGIKQKMELIENGQVSHTWVISVAQKGLGSLKGSEQTPTGVHRIAQKIGAGAERGTIFKARQNTGRIAEILTGADERSTGDNVTTRILWLAGMEPNVNKGGNVDSYERYIYIHGTDEEGRLGQGASHGCIRMKNQDVIDLFDLVSEDTLVVITPN